MLLAIWRTIRSRRSCGSSGSAINSRSRLSSTRGPPERSLIASQAPKTEGKVDRQKAAPLINLYARQACWESILIQTVAGMQSPDSEFRIRTINQDGNLDFRGGDRLDVDAFIGKCLESGRSDAGVAAHADANDRHLHQARFVLHNVVTDRILVLAEHLDGLVHVARRHGEGHVGLRAIFGDVLNDHVDIDVV